MRFIDFLLGGALLVGGAWTASSPFQRQAQIGRNHGKLAVSPRATYQEPPLGGRADTSNFRYYNSKTSSEFAVLDPQAE
jgi:hypothetical protein